MTPATSSSPARVLPSDLGAILSPSQVRCFMECQTRWWFKYGLKYPDPPTANLALGRAVHTSLAQNFAQKAETYNDLPIGGVRALFRESWANESQQVEFHDGEDPVQIANVGDALVVKYMEEIAPSIEPVAVEIHVRGDISGVPVQGWVDVLDVQGRVVDIKTASAKSSRISPMDRFQVATYCRLIPGASGKARIDTLVKTKTPQVTSQNFEFTDADVAATQSLYPLIQKAMREATLMPNRLALNCSRRGCAYWRHCESQWGGEVSET